ncbi:flavin-containing monooxygenase fmo gs-ox-like 3 [Quercus suber]|uniref:Flavin-containing monooxygenase fmo gs-ox-like 3 n=1 Tax=Quercus suber TaxID=58331 RepID=A0AAW0JBH6_QUESU
MERSIKVVVIGASTTGLVTARKLKREGHQVILFEKNNRIGGTGVYDRRVESNPLGMDPGREIVHSRMNHSLRVNLPRQLMGFLDYPFVKKEIGDPRDFPGCEEGGKEKERDKKMLVCTHPIS